MFLEYSKEFEKGTEVSNKRKQRNFKSSSAKEQKKELDNMFLDYLIKIEKDKLYYFIIASQNPQEVLIIKSPSENAAEKKFLGYEWSAAKGKEGIKYLGNAKIAVDDEESEEDGLVALEEDDKRVLGNILNLANIQTPLYDPNDRNNSEKINKLIQTNFIGKSVYIPENLKSFVSKARLVDMLDFKRKEFNKALSLAPRRNINIPTKWPLDSVENIVKTIESGKRPEGGVGNIATGAWSLGGEHIHHNNGTVNLTTPKYVPLPFFNSASKGLLRENDILLCKDGALTGKVAILRKELNNQKAMVNEHVFLLRAEDAITQLYVFNFLFSDLGQELLKFNITGAAQGGLNSTNLKNMKIPFPDEPTRKLIVAECQDIDEVVLNAKKIISDSKVQIEGKIYSLYEKNNNFKRLADPSIAVINPSKRELSVIDDSTIVSFIEMSSVSEDGNIINKEDRPLNQLKSGSYTYFKENDILIAKITPCMENGKCAIAKGLTNQIGMGSSEFHVIRAVGKIDNNFIFTLLNRESVRKEAASNMTGSSGHRRVPGSFYENFKIPVLGEKQEEQFLKEIIKIKDKIDEAQVLIDSVSKQKQKVITRFLYT